MPVPPHSPHFQYRSSFLQLWVCHAEFHLWATHCFLTVSLSTRYRNTGGCNWRMLPHSPLAVSLQDQQDQVRAVPNSLFFFYFGMLRFPGWGPLPPSAAPPRVSWQSFHWYSLFRNFWAWLALPNPFCWLIQTIWPGYAIKFARRPPKFRGILFTSLMGKNAPVLCEKVTVILAMDAIEPIPLAEMNGLLPILDLWVLNRSIQDIKISDFLSRYWHRNAFSHALDTRISLQLSTWKTCIFMFQFCLDTDRFCGLHLRLRHISTKSSHSGCPCLPVFLWSSWRVSCPQFGRLTSVLNYLDNLLI